MGKKQKKEVRKEQWMLQPTAFSRLIDPKWRATTTGKHGEVLVHYDCAATGRSMTYTVRSGSPQGGG